MSRRNHDPWDDYRRDRDDISTAAAFFMTFALLGLVAWVVFFGTGWIVPAAVDILPSRPTRAPATYTTSSASSTAPSFPLVAAATTTPATSAAAVQPATPTPTPKAATKLRVANTGGDGVYLRRSPNDTDLWVPWADNTVVEYLNEEASNGTQTYKKVKDPRGNVGWMPAQYLVPAS